MTSKKQERAKPMGRRWVTHLDGKTLPKDLLTPIVPIANVLAYKSSKPDPKLIHEAEERKLEILVRHLGWHDHFKDKHNKYRIAFLLIREEQTGRHSQDSSVFKELLLNWARENLEGFSIYSFQRGPGRPRERGPKDDLMLVVDLFAVRKKGNVSERCMDLAKDRKLPETARKTLQNKFSGISERQLVRWLQDPRLGDGEREAVTWAIGAKRANQKRHSRKLSTL